MMKFKITKLIEAVWFNVEATNSVKASLKTRNMKPDSQIVLKSSGELLQTEQDRTDVLEIERIVHQAFHDISDKFDIDVDLVAEIVSEYNEIMSQKIEKKVIVSPN